MIEIVVNLGATLNCIEIPGIKNEITYLNGIFGLLAPYRNHGILNFLERCGASSSVKKIKFNSDNYIELKELREIFIKP